jgi:hypothetical protein
MSPLSVSSNPLFNGAGNQLIAVFRGELHIYSSGGHDFGINKTGKTSADWPGALVAWLKEGQLD